MTYKMMRVYPEGRKKKFYFRVYVWDTLEQMHESWQFKSQGKWGTASTIGACIGLEVIKFQGHRPKKLAVLGMVLLCREYLGAGYISHEFSHAALFWAKRVKIIDKLDHWHRQTERFCRAQGEMTRQFVDWGYKHNIFPNIKRTASTKGLEL